MPGSRADEAGDPRRGAAPMSAGGSASQPGDRTGAARREAAAGRHREGRGHDAADLGQPPALGLVPARGRRAGRACRGGRGRRTVRPRPFLDLAAGIHHGDAVGDLPDDAEIMGDEQHRHAELVLQALDQLEDLRLDGDVERGGRLVGDQHLRLAGERHGDHGALAHAARQVVRVLVVALGRARGCRRGRAARWPAARGLPRHAAMEPQRSAICQPIVKTGFSAIIGSWKIMPMPLPRTLRSSRVAQRQDVAPFAEDRTRR